MPTAFVQHARRASLRPFAPRALRPFAPRALRPFAPRAIFAGALAALALSPTAAWATATGGATAAATAGATATSGANTAGATTAGGAAPGTAPGTGTRAPAIATWFGPGFYGSKTACGQKMTPTLIGVASRTLPCGTLVRIAYRGRHLTVPVLDRGPYSHIGASWDLTAGTARALEITETVRIRTTIVGSVPNTPALGEPAPGAEPSGPTAAPTATAATTGGAAAG